MKSNFCAVFFASASMLALAACSSGGNSGATSIGVGGGGSITPPASTVSITGTNILGYGGGTPTEATGATPNFNGSPPASGTVFALDQGALSLTSTTVAGVNAGSGTATFRGEVTVGGIIYPVIDLKIPSLGIDAANLRGDGTTVTQTNGSKVGFVVAGLTYTMLGAWTYKSADASTNYIGLAVAGYQTPAGSVPTTGTATYIGNGSSGATAGGVIGTVTVPSGTGGISAATVTGNVSLNVDFGTQQASGTLTNMTAKDVTSGVTSPWNNVTLTGTLSQSASSSGRGAYLAGTTHAQAAPAGASFGMSSGATGVVSGALFGPSSNEVGAVWSLNDGSGANGRAALGFFGATKQ